MKYLTETVLYKLQKSLQQIKQVYVTKCQMVSSNFWAPRLWDLLVTLLTNWATKNWNSVNKPCLKFRVHDLWKCQNCPVADKCIDTTFTIDILQTRLPPFPYIKRALQTTTLLTKWNTKTHLLIQLQNSNWLTKETIKIKINN